MDLILCFLGRFFYDLNSIVSNEILSKIKCIFLFVELLIAIV